jgi:hypothetical protein
MHASALSRLFPLSGETRAGKTRFTEGRRRHAPGCSPKTGCGGPNEQCVCPPEEGAGTDEMLVIGRVFFDLYGEAIERNPCSSYYDFALAAIDQ